MKESHPIGKFYEAVRLAAIDALTVIRRWEAQGKLLLRRRSFPLVNYRESGLPWFSEGMGILGDTPVEFDYPFRALGDDRVPYPHSWEDVWQAVNEDSRLRVFFDVDKFPPLPASPYPSPAKSIFETRLSKLIDHYIHVTKLRRFRKSKFLPIFRRWAAGCYPEKVPVQFIIPILLLDFDVGDAFELTSSVRIERMSHNLQQSRAPQEDDYVSVNRRILGAATHALVLSGWELPNSSLWDRAQVPSDVGALQPVLPHIERFFAALRIVTGFDTGYGQIITQPDGWSDQWSAHLENVFVLQLQEYPERIQREWQRSARLTVDAAMCERISRVYVGLERGGSNRLAIAARRLNAAYLRRVEEDSIIDVCAALEALFVGDEKNEVTHKLATRLGALWMLSPGGQLSPYQAFAATKRLYDYRSAVVHGSRKAEKKRLIKPRPGTAIEAVTLGLELLRHAVEVTAAKPDLLADGALDGLLLGEAVDLPGRPPQLRADRRDSGDPG